MQASIIWKFRFDNFNTLWLYLLYNFGYGFCHVCLLGEKADLPEGKPLPTLLEGLCMTQNIRIDNFFTGLKLQSIILKFFLLLLWFGFDDEIL